MDLEIRDVNILQRAVGGLLIALMFAASADAQSSALVSALATLKDLNSFDFGHVVDWSKSESPIGSPFFSYEKAEAQLYELSGRDREAVTSWLQSHGRQALYDRGATDGQIGPKRFPIDSFTSPASAATPNPADAWRVVPLVAGTLDPDHPAGGIRILGGFAAVRKDGTAEVHCVSFRNAGDKTATSIQFTASYLDGDSQPLAARPAVRNGTFSPNVDIVGLATLPQYLGTSLGGVSSAMKDNCWTTKTGAATMELLRAKFVGLRVSGVTYSDGTTATP